MAPSSEERASDDGLPDALATVLDGHPERRSVYARLVRALRERGGRCSAPALAAVLARSNATADRRSTYLAVRREYVPTLAALDVVAYDDDDGTVALLVE